MKKILLNFVSILALQAPANAMLSQNAERYTNLEEDQINPKKFLVKCKDEHIVYQNSLELAQLIKEDPDQYEDLFTQLATSSNQIQQNVAYKGLSNLIREEENDWMKDNLFKYIVKKEESKKKYTYKDTKYLGIGAIFLRNTWIGIDKEPQAYETIVIEAIKTLFREKDNRKAYSKYDPETNAAIGIIISHCLRVIGHERQGISNERIRWVSDFIVELAKDSKEKNPKYIRSIYKYIIKGTQYYLDRETESFIYSVVHSLKNSNFTEEFIEFCHLLSIKNSSASIQ